MASNGIVISGTTSYVTVSFYDKTGALSIPSSVTWECYDRSSGSTLQAATALTPASSIEITVPTTINSMVNTQLSQETRIIIVRATYGVGDGLNAVYQYQVQNVNYRQ